MKSNLFILIIAVIGFTLLSSPANADVLSFHKTGHMVIVNVTQPTINFYALDSNMGFLLSNNTLEVYPVGAGSNENLMYSEFTLNDGSCTANTGNDCYIDLGAVYKINEIDQFLWQNQKDRTFEWYGSTTSPTTGFSLLVSSAYPDQTTGFKNNTFALTSVRYLRYAFTFASTHFMSVSEIVIKGNPLPNITSWSNSFTGNASLNLSPPTTTTVIFAVNSVDQSVTTYNWTLDGIDQNTNFSSFQTQFTQTSHTLSVTVTNSNGTSTPVTWTINGALPSPPQIPQGSNAAIAFDLETYTVGQGGFILTNVSQTILDFFGINTYHVDFFSTKIPLINQYQIDLSTNTQSFPVSFNTADTYTANLIQHNILIGTDTIIATDSAQAVLPQGFINAPNLVQVGKNFNVTYQFAATPTFSHINGIKTFFIDAGVPVQENFFTVGNTAAGTQFTTQIYVNKKGSYILYLFDAGRGNVASKAIQSDFFQDTNTTLNITTSNITLLNPQPSNAYGFNDLMQVNFQVDNSNWTNGSQQIMIDVFNTDTNTETISFPVIDQVGAFSFFLQNGYYPNGFFASGNNQVRLIAQNGGTRVLDFKTFTLSGINDAGYGLILDKFIACIDENIKITYTSPAPANFSIQQIQSSGNVQLEFGSVNGTRTLTRTFSRTGSYLIQLIRQSDNTIQQEAKVTINDCGATPVPTTTPSPIEAATGLIGILGNIAFYGFVLWLGIIGAIAAYMSRSPSGVNGGSLVFIGALASTFISIIGLFGDFKIYVLVITWVLAGVYWRFARDSTTG